MLEALDKKLGAHPMGTIWMNSETFCETVRTSSAFEPSYPVFDAKVEGHAGIYHGRCVNITRDLEQGVVRIGENFSSDLSKPPAYRPTSWERILEGVL